MQFSDSPELVGTASLPADAAQPSVAVATAIVLDAFAWPIVSVDSAQGTLMSDWQYFEPAVRGSSRQGYCVNPVALRFAVRAFKGNWSQIAAEAYLPRPEESSGWSSEIAARPDPARGEALTQARAALASLRKAVAATGGVQGAEISAMTDFGKSLDNGGFRRCADQGR